MPVSAREQQATGERTCVGGYLELGGTVFQVCVLQPREIRSQDGTEALECDLRRNHKRRPAFLAERPVPKHGALGFVLLNLQNEKREVAEEGAGEGCGVWDGDGDGRGTLCIKRTTC